MGFFPACEHSQCFSARLAKAFHFHFSSSQPFFTFTFLTLHLLLSCSCWSCVCLGLLASLLGKLSDKRAAIIHIITIVLQQSCDLAPNFFKDRPLQWGGKQCASHRPKYQMRHPKYQTNQLKYQIHHLKFEIFHPIYQIQHPKQATLVHRLGGKQCASLHPLKASAHLPRGLDSPGKNKLVFCKKNCERKYFRKKLR